MSVELAKEGLPQAGSQNPRGFGMESCVKLCFRLNAIPPRLWLIPRELAFKIDMYSSHMEWCNTGSPCQRLNFTGSSFHWLNYSVVFIPSQTLKLPAVLKLDKVTHKFQ